jgi:hypothetical protein
MQQACRYPSPEARKESLHERQNVLRYRVFFTVEAKYYLAANSIAEKQEERVTDAIKAADNFLLAYKISEHTSQVTATREKAIKLQDKRKINYRKTSK